MEWKVNESLIYDKPKTTQHRNEKLTPEQLRKREEKKERKEKKKAAAGLLMRR
jgi:hypothetical protein